MGYLDNAIATTRGWVSPAGELLKSQRMTQAQVDAHNGVSIPEEVVETEADKVDEDLTFPGGDDDDSEFDEESDDDDEVLEYSTDPELIFEKWQYLVDLVIDGGYGDNVGSTIIDLSGYEPVVIREGKGDPDIF